MFCIILVDLIEEKSSAWSNSKESAQQLYGMMDPPLRVKTADSETFDCHEITDFDELPM